mmetsp:Transcript_4062/g.4986  ORF Transcript_4062/g.4986 Transcript_4062/m.4986 type:complete len:202 (-) Transcript_4062:337-942(-)
MNAKLTGSSGRYTRIVYSLGAIERNSFSRRSFKLGIFILPPVNTMLWYIAARYTGSHASIDCTIASASPNCLMPISDGRNSNSGTVKRSTDNSSACLSASSISLLCCSSCRCWRILCRFCSIVSLSESFPSSFSLLSSSPLVLLYLSSSFLSISLLSTSTSTSIELSSISFKLEEASSFCSSCSDCGDDNGKANANAVFFI